MGTNPLGTLGRVPWNHPGLGGLVSQDHVHYRDLKVKVGPGNKNTDEKRQKRAVEWTWAELHPHIYVLKP